MGSVFRRTGSSYWYLDYRVGGRRFKESTKAKTKAQALALLAKREAEAFEGKHFPDKRLAGLTMAKLRELWLEHAAGKRSLEDDRQRFRTIVEHFGPTTQVATLTPSDVERFRAKILRSAPG